MSVFYVYIFETISKKGKKSFYTGYTNDLLRRRNQHRSGIGAKYLRGKKKIKLRYYEICTSRKEAMKRELEIKSFSRRKKIELVNNFINR